ncbi:polysaccharide deacetylase family protein [Acidobacteria bacterium AH-259-D05]|nr:polysaccharide deacetylase family protein [Acidobacteria bacterium AH-259-D05]
MVRVTATRIGYWIWRVYLLASKGKDCSLILLYHCIGDPSPYVHPPQLVSVPNFEDQLRTLKRFNVISLLDYARGHSQQALGRSLIITFDDSYRHNYLNALPLLKKYRLQATFCIPTGFIDEPTTGFWDKIWFLLSQTDHEKLTITTDHETTYSLTGTGNKLAAFHELNTFAIENDHRTGHTRHFIDTLAKKLEVDVGAYPSSDLVLSWDEIRDLASEMEVGSHTVSHWKLSKLDEHTEVDEIAQSKELIEHHTGKPCVLFAYPQGDFTVRTQRVIRETGYLCAASTIPGTNYAQTDPYELRRFTVPNIGGYAFKYWLMRKHLSSSATLRKLMEWLRARDIKRFAPAEITWRR